MSEILRKLSGGDRRSIGRSDEVAREIAEDPKLFAQVFDAPLGADAVVRMRAADAVEKATRKHPELLQPYTRRILQRVAPAEQQEVRWHVAQMLPRLQLTASERDWAVSILLDFLEDKSSIVRTFAMQGLADLALQDALLRRRIVPIVESLTSKGSPAMRSRGRTLLALLRR
jgi:hypothetical protein